MFDKVFSKITGLISKYKEKKSVGSAGWISYLVIGTLAFSVVAFLAYKLWRSGKELAKLKHEKAVMEEKAHQAKVDARLAEDEDAKQAALARATVLKQEVKDIENKVKVLEEAHDITKGAIDAISSWNDVDELVK